MTFSLLSLDKTTGILAGASATGNLCVGGWVLRGHPFGGLTASQGAEPSIVWGDETLKQMENGVSASNAIKGTTNNDPRREYRQIAAIDIDGKTNVYSGGKNGVIIDEIVEDGLVLAGNILSNRNVLKKMYDTFKKPHDSVEEKLIASLRAGAKAGGDSRGLMSAALLVFKPQQPPITLRVDYHETPIDQLENILKKIREPAYDAWFKTLPSYQKEEKIPK